MKIANLTLPEKPLLLAPMEDVTDPAFRSLCKQFGADLVYTEFIAADALIRSVKSTTRKLEIRPEERPVAIQIYGREVAPMVEAAQIVEQAKPDLIDLNFGCPVKKVAGKGAGAGMLRTPEKLLEITREVVRAVKTPVTVKTRLGWDADHIIIPRLSEELQDCGIAALTIHGRTRSQMYTGAADWSIIAQVKSNPRLKIPVIGNGDITTPSAAADAFARFGVDAVMVGRGAIGCPWIFAQMKNFLQGKPAAELSFTDQIAVLKTIATENLRALGDERRALLHTRRHLAAAPTFKGLPNFRQTRIAMLRTESIAELFALLDGIKKTL